MNLPFTLPTLNWVSLAFRLIGAAILIGIGYGICYKTTFMPEHDAFLKFKTQSTDAGKAQVVTTASTNTTNTEATLNAEQSRAKAIQDLDAWYTTHPIVKWMRVSPGGCALPGPSGNSEESQPVPAQADESPGFSPQECSFYAGELEGLLDLLHKSPNVKFAQ